MILHIRDIKATRPADEAEALVQRFACKCKGKFAIFEHISGKVVKL